MAALWLDSNDDSPASSKSARFPGAQQGKTKGNLRIFNCFSRATLNYLLRGRVFKGFKPSFFASLAASM